MLLDLRNQAEPHAEISTEVCIIGSGVAGLLLAHRLRKNGRRVVVLETGGREATDDAHPLNEVVQLGQNYAGALNGRARCLGGTSTRWGGAMIPFLPADFDERPYLDMPKWPVAFDDLARFIPEIEKLFSLDGGSFEGEFLEQFGDDSILPSKDPDFLARFAKWPQFRIRNLANLFRADIAGDPDLLLCCNANVTSFGLGASGARISQVVAQSDNGKSLTVAAAQFVICGGAIESTRLLLWLDRTHANILSSRSDALGYHFHDHVSLIAADLEPKDPIALNRIAGFRFVGSTMRSLRFELSPAAQAQARVASAFGHIAFTTTQPTTFDALRDLLREIQKNGRPRLASLRRFGQGAPDLALIAYWRLRRRQLRWPQPAAYQFHIVLEQLPSRQNRIALADRADRFGIPLASIDWRVMPHEKDVLEAYAGRFDSYWARHGLTRAASLKWRDSSSVMGAAAESTDVFHPGGSTRMGASSHNAVVDENLRVFGLDNLHVSSTSVFPSGGSANPTFMLMLFTCRLADFLAGQLERRP